jgi:hypothetical protein
MIHILQPLFARYASGAPDKYRPDGINKEQYYQVVAEKITKRVINITAKDKNLAESKQIEEISLGVINKNNRLVFFTAQNADIVCQQTAEEINKKLIAINQETIQGIKDKQSVTDEKLKKLSNLVDQFKKG